MTVDGTIVVNGESGVHGNYRSGGGSGGTVQVYAHSFVGRGNLESNGGNGYGGTFYDIDIGLYLNSLRANNSNEWR